MYSQSRHEESAPSSPNHPGEASPRPFLPRARLSPARSPEDPPQVRGRPTRLHAAASGVWAASHRAAATPGSSPRLPAAPRSQAADSPRAPSREQTRGPTPAARSPNARRRAEGAGPRIVYPLPGHRGRRSTAPPRPAGPARVLDPAPPSFQRPLRPAGRTAWLGRYTSRSGDRGYGFERLEPRLGERRPDLGGWTELGTRQGGAGCPWYWCRRGPARV